MKNKSENRVQEFANIDCIFNIYCYICECFGFDVKTEITREFVINVVNLPRIKETKRVIAYKWKRVDYCVYEKTAIEKYYGVKRAILYGKFRSIMLFLMQ